MARAGRTAGRGRGGEPAFNAPWTAAALAASMPLLFLGQTLLGVDRVAERLGLRPIDVAQGRLSGLVTVLLVHGSWMHAGLNALSALAFGAPVARALGVGARGALAFLAFYLASGVLSGLGFVAAHPHGGALVVGASGAVSGLIGAASRLLPGRRGLLPLDDRRVLAMALAWGLGNLVLGATALGRGLAGASIAWEAHLAGYAAGLILLPVFLPTSPRRG